MILVWVLILWRIMAFMVGAAIVGVGFALVCAAAVAVGLFHLAAYIIESVKTVSKKS